MTTHDRLTAAGFYCYREHFMWGRMLAYRNSSSVKSEKAVYFVELGKIYTPKQMLEKLKAEWRPAADSERSYFCDGLESDFAILPDCEPFE